MAWTFNQCSAITISQNSFTSDSASNDVGISIKNSGTTQFPIIFANNVVNMLAANTVGLGIAQDNSSFSFVRILNNSISTANTGTGIAMTMTQGDLTHFAALAQGNDFHNNAIGVSVTGDGLGSGTVDLGLGDLSSLGGNDFRGFISKGTATHAAIVLNASTGGAVIAMNNMFSSGVSALVADFNQNGTILVNQELSDQRAFVQSLYNGVLGRSGGLGELDPWVSVLNAQGQGTVVNALVRSAEGLGRIVDSLYLRFLGRQSDTGGRNSWTSFLQNGGTEEQVENSFLTSPEYLSHISFDFVQSLYINFLGRSGGPGELAFWNNSIQTLGLAGIANGFVTSGESRQNALTTDFKVFLHRIPASSELTPLTNSNHDLLSLQVSLLSTTEFFNNG